METQSKYIQQDCQLLPWIRLFGNRPHKSDNGGVYDLGGDGLNVSNVSSALYTVYNVNVGVLESSGT